MTFNDFLIHISHSFQLILNLFRIRRRYKTDVRLDGKVVVITGANTGLGKETALQLSLIGAKVLIVFDLTLTNILSFNEIIIGCRNLTKAENAIKDINEKNPLADITAFKLDLSSLQSVRQFSKLLAEKVSTIDILINNGAVGVCPEWQSEDGFELQFATNHLGIKLFLNSLFY